MLIEARLGKTFCGSSQGTGYNDRRCSASEAPRVGLKPTTLGLTGGGRIALSPHARLTKT